MHSPQIKGISGTCHGQTCFGVFILSLDFSSLLLSQRLITEVNKFNKLKIEYDAISSNKITNDLFFSPYIQKKPSNKIVSLGYKHYFQIEPTFELEKFGPVNSFWYTSY